MCPGKILYKNLVIAASCSGGVLANNVSPIVLPFVPDAVEVTSVSYFHDAAAPDGAIFNITTSFLPTVPLAQITTIAVKANYNLELHNTFELPSFSNGTYSIHLHSPFTGAIPPTGNIIFAINLLFTRKLDAM
jgi:hypothetical protein